MKFAFVQRHATEHAVKTLCRVLQVSKAGYYAWTQRAPSARAAADAVLSERIHVIHTASRRTYGSPRVHAELAAQGQAHGVNRIARLMRQHDWRAKTRRRRCVTTDSRHAHPIAPNVVDRQFAIAPTTAVDTTWVGDITYLPTREGFLYLAIVLDLASRHVIGWAMRHTLEGAITYDALMMAIARRRPGAGLVHHSDRGSQYAAHAYRALLAAHGMVCSMSRVGNCWDNAVAESFFGTLKRELADGADWATREDARAAVFEYIEVWYNRQRRHSSLGFLSPVAYEHQQTSLLVPDNAA